MLTLSQQVVLSNFAKDLVELVKVQIKSKPIKRVSVRQDKGKVTRYTFNSPVNASGSLLSSITYELTDTSLILKGNDYIYYLLYGRKPTRNSGNGSLKNDIKSWMRSKGIRPTDGISEDTLAFLITRKIHRYGSSIYLSRQPKPELLQNVLNNTLINNYNAKFTQQLEEELRDIWLQI